MADFRQRYPQEVWPSPTQNTGGVPMYPRDQMPGAGPNDPAPFDREQQATTLAQMLRLKAQQLLGRQ